MTFKSERSILQEVVRQLEQHKELLQHHLRQLFQVLLQQPLLQLPMERHLHHNLFQYQVPHLQVILRLQHQRVLLYHQMVLVIIQQQLLRKVVEVQVVLYMLN
jgi:hypothetical protein